MSRGRHYHGSEFREIIQIDRTPCFGDFGWSTIQVYRDVGHNAESCCSAKESDEVEWNRAYVILSDCSLSEPEIRFLVQIQFVKIFLTVLYFCCALLQPFAEFKTVFL